MITSFHTLDIQWRVATVKVSSLLATLFFTLPAVSSSPRTVYQTMGTDNVPLFTDRAVSKASRMISRVTESTASLQPCFEQSKTVLTRKVSRRRQIPEEIHGVIRSAARAYALEETLLHAVVKAESAYNVKAVSKAGAVGLMQLMPGTAVRYGVTDRTDAFQSVHGGARYLRDLLELFDGDLALALAGYNAGENAVLRHGSRIPPYRETQDYVSKIMTAIACAEDD
jgi:hypothetical protein